MRKKIVAGNWKMNKNYTEAQELMHELDRYKKNNAINCEVYIAPPSLYITTAKNIFLNDNVGVLLRICRNTPAELILVRFQLICWLLLMQQVLLLVT